MNEFCEVLNSLRAKGELTLAEQQLFESTKQAISMRISELETENMLLSGVHEEMSADICRELDELRSLLDGSSLVR